MLFVARERDASTAVTCDNTSGYALAMHRAPAANLTCFVKRTAPSDHTACWHATCQRVWLQQGRSLPREQKRNKQHCQLDSERRCKGCRSTTNNSWP